MVELIIVRSIVRIPLHILNFFILVLFYPCGFAMYALFKA